MDIKKILEYQNAEIEFEKTRETFAEIEFFKKVKILQKNKKFYEEKLEKSYGLQNAHEGALNTINQDVLDILKDIEDIQSIDINSLDIDDIEDNLKDLEDLKNKALDLKTQGKGSWDAFVEANRDITTAKTELEKIQAIYEPLKPKIAEFNAKVKAALDDATNKKAEIAKTLTEEEKAIYNEARAGFTKEQNSTLKNSQLARVFVPNNGGYCRCGIQLDSEHMKKLFDKGYVRCSACGRIVYKEN